MRGLGQKLMEGSQMEHLESRILVVFLINIATIPQEHSTKV